MQYIYNNAFGREKADWAAKEPFVGFLHYYWNGAGGKMMLGRHAYIVMALALAALFLKKNGRARSWRFAAGYLLVIALTYAVPTAVRMENPFFAAPTDVLILFAGVFLLSWMLGPGEPGQTWNWAAPAAAIAAVVVALVSFRWPSVRYSKGDLRTDAINRMGEQIYSTIADYPGSHNARVFFTAPGPVDDMLLRYHALINGRNFLCPDLHVSTDLSVYRTDINQADFVVASEPGSGVVDESMDGARLQMPALEMARANPNLVQIARLPGLNGKFFFIFARRSLSAADDNRTKILPFDNPWAPLYAR